LAELEDDAAGVIIVGVLDSINSEEVREKLLFEQRENSAKTRQ